MIFRYTLQVPSKGDVLRAGEQVEYQVLLTRCEQA